MDTILYSLEQNQSTKSGKAIRLIFGITCIVLAFCWLIINLQNDISGWYSILPLLFVALFGLYMILNGLGKTDKYIEISRDSITFKQNAIFPAKIINTIDIQRIEIHPLSIVFYQFGDRKTIFRFGTSFQEIIDPVKEAIDDFAANSSIESKYVVEEIYVD